LIDKILDTAGIATVLTGVRMPLMNSIIERWTKTVRGELLGRSLSNPIRSNPSPSIDVTVLGESSTSTTAPLDQHGCSFRHAQGAHYFDPHVVTHVVFVSSFHRGEGG
jgi:hypothetical protein